MNRNNLYSGERLLNKLADLPPLELFMAVYEDRRVNNTELARVSGYHLSSIIKNYKKAKEGKLSNFVLDIVSQAARICAANVYSNPVNHEGFSLYVKENTRCETGLCDESMLKMQNISSRRGLNVRKLTKELEKSRQWFYIQKQQAMLECQTLTICDNWNLIIKAYEAQNANKTNP